MNGGIIKIKLVKYATYVCHEVNGSTPHTMIGSNRVFISLSIILRALNQLFVNLIEVVFLNINVVISCSLGNISYKC